MRRYILIIILILVLLAPIIWHVYTIKKYNGNLVFAISNVSNLEKVRMEILLDNKVIINDMLKQDRFFFKQLSFYTSLGNHTIIYNTYNLNNKLLLSDTTKTVILFKWISVEFQSEDTLPDGWFVDDAKEGYSTFNYMIYPRNRPPHIIM